LTQPGRDDPADRSRSAGTHRGRTRDRVLRLLPGLILTAVACHQIVLAHTSDLAAWSGGGFGMFASTDAGATRHLHAYVRRPGLRRELRPADADEDRVRRALTLPSDANLRRLAASLATLPTPDHGPATALEIQVWYTVFDPATLAPDSRILRAIEIPLGPE
jgi:hypothetical protein